MIRVSVIICTHNPRQNYLHRVLRALRAQTLPRDQWELLLIDNASDRGLAQEWDLGWHPQARHIREDELGLTPARLRGIAEGRGEILVFVDDDNVLDVDYLNNALEIGRDYPFIGAWGGTIRGEFEAEPAVWMQPLLSDLAIRAFSEPIWSNNPTDWRSQPCGAGLCVRSPVAKQYAEQVAEQPIRRKLGRIGAALSSCEDSDLALTSRDLGKGFGNFPQLRMVHLIPESRVRPDYIIRVSQGITVSGIVLHYLRYGILPVEPSVLNSSAKYLMLLATQGRRPAQIYRASQKAIRMGIRTARGFGLDDCARHAGPSPQLTAELDSAEG
jgi:glycosyltransferase involved in cell wall biosynthesis